VTASLSVFVAKSRWFLAAEGIVLIQWFVCLSNIFVFSLITKNQLYIYRETGKKVALKFTRQGKHYRQQKTCQLTTRLDMAKVTKTVRDII
jgi:hypothetical protein